MIIWQLVATKIVKLQEKYSVKYFVGTDFSHLKLSRGQLNRVIHYVVEINVFKIVFPLGFFLKHVCINIFQLTSLWYFNKFLTSLSLSDSDCVSKIYFLI